MAQLTAEQKIATLLEQTNFLLEKQQEAFEESKRIYGDLITLVVEKSVSEEDPGEKKHLKEIHDLLKQQAEYITDSMADDVKFLKEQQSSLAGIKNDVTDPQELQELVDMLLEDGEKIPDLEEFKADVLSEAQQSKEHLSVMVADFKDALQDGNNIEIKQYLQALLEEDESEHDSEEDDFSIDCGSCQGCGTGDGCGAPLELDDEHCDDNSEKSRECSCGKGSCGCGGTCGKGSKDIFAMLDDDNDEHKA